VTTEQLKGLSDAELSALGSALNVEVREREEKRKQDAIAKIRAIASSAHIPVSIGGMRGRPPKKQEDKAVKNGR